MKEIIKKILMKIFYFLSFFRKNKDIKFIYYHDVVPKDGYSYQKIEVNKFKNQMRYLVKNEYKTLTFDELDKDEICSSKNKEKMVLITFDDGWLSNYETVFPIMKELNLKFNIFLEVGAIGEKENYITWDMISEMADSGLVGFGAHTFNHIDARLINQFNVDTEIIESNKIILNKTGLNIKDFCFPYGYYDNKVIDYLDELNVYKRIYTSDGRKLSKKNNIDIIGRVGIENEDTEKNFVSKLEGRYNSYYYVVDRLKGFMGVCKNGIFKRS